MFANTRWSLSNCRLVWENFLFLPPEALVTAEPAGATLVTAAGLYVQEVPHTSTLRSLSE